MQKTTMFYDGGCPLCRKEVAHYIKLDHQQRIAWLDIHADPSVLEPYAISQAHAMQRLHALDREGKVQSGAWAFATIWADLPYYRHLATVVRTLRLLPLIDFAYRHFAKWRYRSRCKTGYCSR
ncbi:MAG: thiol-disulfide oxidoreductase DCC family protein [bacterium]